MGVASATPNLPLGEAEQPPQAKRPQRPNKNKNYIFYYFILHLFLKSKLLFDYYF
jgi:hypothetical protein